MSSGSSVMICPPRSIDLFSGAFQVAPPVIDTGFAQMRWRVLPDERPPLHRQRAPANSPQTAFGRPRRPGNGIRVPRTAAWHRSDVCSAWFRQPENPPRQSTPSNSGRSWAGNVRRVDASPSSRIRRCTSGTEVSAPANSTLSAPALSRSSSRTAHPPSWAGHPFAQHAKQTVRQPWILFRQLSVVDRTGEQCCDDVLKSDHRKVAGVQAEHLAGPAIPVALVPAVSCVPDTSPARLC
jgi:hypothetical protein